MQEISWPPEDLLVFQEGLPMHKLYGALNQPLPPPTRTNACPYLHFLESLKRCSSN